MKVEWLCFCFAILIRVLTGIHGYSGQSKPPNYGDYEAQRHWMEITINTPIQEWYVQTEDNNLTYWGLDYPPLSAYQSWAYGKVLEALEPEMVALYSSRGYESSKSKRYMRNSVLVSDVLVFIPLMVLAIKRLNKESNEVQRAWSIFATLLQPLFVLIDHGHFQYNGLSLGLTAGAIGALCEDEEIIGSVLFCLALNHKQMTMYFAPAFFAHLLGKQLRRKTLSAKFLGIAKLGATVIATFVVCWAPFLTSSKLFFQVVDRLVPVKRGLYEDYVANFWCASSYFVKWKQLYPQQFLVKICGILTSCALLPSCVMEGIKPSKKGFLYCIANSAWAFFLFSYQVHEKSVLLPLLPITLLAPEEPFLVVVLGPISALSCFPLLLKDGILFAYIGTIAVWIAGIVLVWSDVISGASPNRKVLNIDIKVLIIIGSVLGGVCLHLLQVLMPPLERLPFLHPRLMTTYAFVHFGVAAVYTNWKHISRSYGTNAQTAKLKGN